MTLHFYDKNYSLTYTQITLLSRRPALRKAAAATLRHLAERDPHTLLSARLEGALFASLDGEVNAAIAGVCVHCNVTLLHCNVSLLHRNVSLLHCNVSLLHCNVSLLHCNVSLLHCNVSLLHCNVSLLHCNVSLLHTQ